MRDPSSYTPLAEAYWKDDRRSLTLSFDAAFNERQIGRFSQRDAQVMIDSMT